MNARNLWLRAAIRSLIAARIVLATSLVLVISVVASALYHVQFPATRRVVAALVNDFVSGEIKGRLHISEITKLRLGKVVTANISLYDAQGRRVAFADEVSLKPDIVAAFSGVIRFSRVRLKNAKVTLYESPSGLPTLITAFEPKDPTPGIGPPLHAIVDDIRLGDVDIQGDILGLRGIAIENFKAHWRLEAQDEMTITVYSATGTLIEPFPFHARLQSLKGRVSSDSIQGIRLQARARIHDEHYTASISYAKPELNRDAELSLLVRTKKASARTLQGLGFDWARLIATDAAGALWLHGPVDAMNVSGGFRTSAGQVELSGTIGENTTDLQLRTERLEIHKALLGAPEITAAGTVRLILSDEDPKVMVDVSSIPYRGFVFPTFKMRGRILDDKVAIDRLDSDHLGGTITAKGYAGFDGRVRLDIRADIPDVKADPNLPPGLSAGIKANLAIDTRNPVTKDLEARGKLELRHLRYKNISAQELILDGRFRGNARQPHVDLRASGQGASVSGYPLSRFELTVAGGPDHYSARGIAVSDASKSAEFDATIYASPDSYLVQASSIVASAGTETWRGSINGLVYVPDHSVSVERIILANGSQRLELVGTYRFHGTDDFEANLQDFDLGGLQKLLGRNLYDMQGRVDVHATMRGQLSDPDLLIEGALREGQVAGLNAIEAVYVAQYSDSALEVDAQAEIEGRTVIALNGTGQLDLQFDKPAESFQQGTYQMALTVEHLSLDTIRRVSRKDFKGISGNMHAEVTASGSLADFLLDGTVQLGDLVIGRFSGMEARSTFSYGDRALLAKLEVNDAIGRLIEAEGAFHIDPIATAEQPSTLWSSIFNQPWQLSARMTPRRLDQLPGPLAWQVPYAAVLAAEAQLHGNSQQTRGRLRATTTWSGEGKDAGRGARLTMVAKLDDNRLYASFRGAVDKKRALKAEAYAPMPLHTWIRQPSLVQIPPVRFTGHVWRMPLEHFPFAPPYSSGPVDVSWDAKNLFTAKPVVNVKLRSHALRFSGTEPLAVEFAAKTTNTGVSFGGSTSDVSGGKSHFNGALPVRWLAKAPFVTLDKDAPVAIRARFERARLQPIFAAIPSVADADAIAVGALTLRGSLNNVLLNGTVSVDHGHVQIIGLGQQLVNIRGKVIFNGKWAQLVDLRAEDGEGRTRIQGGIGFDGLRPTRVRISLNSRKFPVRREGSILATLTGNARFSAAITDERMDAKLDVTSLSVALPDDQSSGIQELQPHPDLIVDGIVAGEEDDSEPFTVRMQIDARQPFWVRRSDFSIQVASELDITYEKSELYIEGYARLRRGFFDLFGKHFILQRGTINFDGSSELNPEVNIQATHELSTGSGVSVTMTVDGRLRTPTVEFTSTHPDCQERSQVIDLLISGRCSGSDRGGNVGAAEEQTASFLAGITAGILTLGARREFGDLIPVISIETGQGGFASTRARLGYQADTIIPKFMKPYVLGAYVEGAFPLATSDEQAQQQQQQQQYQQQGSGTRFLLELQFPYSLVGTTQYWPPGTWGFDLTWEP